MAGVSTGSLAGDPTDQPQSEQAQHADLTASQYGEGTGGQA